MECSLESELDDKGGTVALNQAWADAYKLFGTPMYDV